MKTQFLIRTIVLIFSIQSSEAQADDKPLPRFADGEVLKADQLNAVADAVVELQQKVAALQKQLAAQGRANPGSTREHELSSDRSSETIAEGSGFRLSLEGCSRGGGGSVTCTFIVASEAGDQNLALKRKGTRMIDDRATEYPLRMGILGMNKQADIGIYNRVVAGVPMRGSVEFSDVSSEANSAALIELACDSCDDNTPFQWRNIPFR